MIYKNVTRYIEVKNRIIDALHGRPPYSFGESDIRGASAGWSRSVRCAFQAGVMDTNVIIAIVAVVVIAAILVIGVTVQRRT